MFLLDVGSHSVKLYCREKNFKCIKTETWEILDSNIQYNDIEYFISQFLCEIKEFSKVRAFATEAARRDKLLAEKLKKIFKKKKIKFNILSQKEEAELIKKSFPSTNHAIVNVGGGSMQFVFPNSTLKLLDFGISDLNNKFDLNSVNVINRANCLNYLESSLPQVKEGFIYTGGEKEYLNKMGVVLQENYCGIKEFKSFHDRLSKLSVEDLMDVSPFDPKWMKGAIASNLIILALLKNSKLNGFTPSNINISHGFLSNYID